MLCDSTVPLCSGLLCSNSSIVSLKDLLKYYKLYSCTNSSEDGPVGPKHVEIQQYTNKIVTSVGFHSIYWKDAQYEKLKK